MYEPTVKPAASRWCMRCKVYRYWILDELHSLSYSGWSWLWDGFDFENSVQKKPRQENLPSKIQRLYKSRTLTNSLCNARISCFNRVIHINWTDLRNVTRQPCTLSNIKNATSLRNQPISLRCSYGVRFRYILPQYIYAESNIWSYYKNLFQDVG